jgi:hypothetical protein
MDRQHSPVIKDWLELREPYVIPIPLTQTGSPIQSLVVPIVYPIRPLSAT